MELDAWAARFHAPCPFKVGDLVTPAIGSFWNHIGEPMKVVEVYDKPRYLWSDDPESAGSPALGSRCTMRIILLSGQDNLCIYGATADHADFVAYRSK